MTEAELLFTELLNCNRLSLYLNRSLHLDKNKSSNISSVLKRRIRGEPIQYILGKTEFMGLEFKITPNVFIPRPETEILVETVTKLVSKYQSIKVSSIDILDLCTGSGCIAISLAKLLSNVSITATDVSQEALNIAQENAKINRIADKITFLKSNLFESLAICDMRYAICLSNPPYIPTAEIDRLQPEIQYEPRIALDGGKDGLDFYRRIIDKAPRYLKNDGFLIMEMGFKQKDAIKNIIQESKDFQILEFVKDYNDIDRVIVAQKKRRNG